MLALQIEDTKDFMNKLLLNATFDHFALIECSISTYMTTTIDGRLNKSFYSKEELEEKSLLNEDYAPWELLRPFCLQLVKGKRAPIQMKLTFSLSNENIKNVAASIHLPFSAQNIKGLLVNFRYDGKQILVSTATSLSAFSMDKTLDFEWDRMLEKFLKKHEIICSRI